MSCKVWQVRLTTKGSHALPVLAPPCETVPQFKTTLQKPGFAYFNILTLACVILFVWYFIP